MSHKSWHAPIGKPISGLYCDVTPIQALYKPQQKATRLQNWAGFLKQMLSGIVALMVSQQQQWKLKLTINVDDLSDGLWVVAIASELHAEDCAVDTPKIEFSVNKILAEKFFNNPSDDILYHFSKRPFI